MAVFEVKLLERTPKTAENGWQVVARDGMTESTRLDNAPARVGRVIHTAFKQLQRYSLLERNRARRANEDVRAVMFAGRTPESRAVA
jgi:hypothetical protein